MASWEFILVSLSVGFANGGFAGLFVCFIVTVSCFFSVVVSLAEMASMAPTSGGQYRKYWSLINDVIRIHSQRQRRLGF
jgi:choline transport protein